MLIGQAQGMSKFQHETRSKTNLSKENKRGEACNKS